MLRLRQICLVAPELAPAEALVRRIFGLEVCHRDEAVAKYGLVNALFVFGHQFLEIVAPTRDGTAAGRFLERSGGRGGYMAIFDTRDPERRQALVESLGVRIANTMSVPGFHGIQLHPRDARATMLEFDRSDGNEQLDGAYWPAGPHWREHQRLDRVAGIPWVDVETPDVNGLAVHWARIIDVPIGVDDDDATVLRFDLGGVRFRPGTPERLAAVHVEVQTPEAVLAAARGEGLAVEDGGFDFCGVRMLPRRAQP
ncbi:VOC family protein [Piscinibacter gummiphilus]|uniref:VOC family protein n=1 Tax=Piscinibacter gummiphilus TaxID=946333 RepID=A0ABZ0CVS3_9BURK|nr:VOC family protein [Piscinibacter gummiphilus]WOB06614.1 VOC family protein [Piscinibacter gummiphilus]